MSAENKPNTEISRGIVIEIIRETPQTFYDLLDKFGISKDLNDKKRHSKEYIKLLNIVSILETRRQLENGTEIRPVVGCAKKEKTDEYILYLTENEQKLINSGQVREIDGKVIIFLKEYYSNYLKLTEQSVDTLFVPSKR